MKQTQMGNEIELKFAVAPRELLNFEISAWCRPKTTKERGSGVGLL